MNTYQKKKKKEFVRSPWLKESLLGEYVVLNGSTGWISFIYLEIELYIYILGDHSQEAYRTHI